MFAREPGADAVGVKGVRAGERGDGLGEIVHADGASVSPVGLGVVGHVLERIELGLGGGGRAGHGWTGPDQF